MPIDWNCLLQYQKQSNKNMSWQKRADRNTV